MLLFALILLILLTYTLDECATQRDILNSYELLVDLCSFVQFCRMKDYESMRFDQDNSLKLLISY